MGGGANGIRLVAALLAATIAMGWDLREGRVPNALIGITLIFACLMVAGEILWGEGILSGLRWNAAPDEARTALQIIWQSIGGFFIPLVFPGILFWFGMMGGGDIKLLSVIGALLGIGAIVRIVAVCFFAGALQSLLLIMVRRDGRAALRRVLTYGKMCVALRCLPDYRKVTGANMEGKAKEQTGKETVEPVIEQIGGKHPGSMHFTVSILAAVLWYVLCTSILHPKHLLLRM